MNERYWLQRSRINWALSGDNNTRYFHATAVARKRCNSINAILFEMGHWVTEPKEITRLFVNHFMGIYTKRATTNIRDSFDTSLLTQLPKLQLFLHEGLQAEPSDLEIK